MKMDIGSVCGKLRRLSGSRHCASKLLHPLSSFPGTLPPSHPDLSPDPAPSTSPHRDESSSVCFRSLAASHSSRVPNIKLLKPYTQSLRFYSAEESRIRLRRPDRRRLKVEQVMELIRSRPDGLRSKLDALNVRLPVSSLVGILLSMNAEKIPALEFFEWVRASYPERACHPDICSLAVDNCGRLEDYGAAVALLKELSSKGVSLNRKAFGFLNVLASSSMSVKDSVGRMVGVLKEAGGSCLVSGVCGLIEMFSSSGSMDMAKYVVRITEQRVSYYNILMREMCRKCDFEGAKCLLLEMRQSGCGPSDSTYNYVISSLCKNNQVKEAREMLEEMQGSDCPPNALTFEILICYYLRRTGEVDTALELLNKMVLMGIEPRPTTNAAFIKAYFSSERREEAYDFVISSRLRGPINTRYSLLANLYQKEGNLIEAQKVLAEMMDKGLRPNNSVYKRVQRRLLKSGETELAQRLDQLITQFSSDAG